MKMIILLVVLVAAAVSAQPQMLVKKPIIPIVFMSDKRDDLGQYAITYVTGDGTTVMEEAALKLRADGLDYVLVKKGTLSYTSPEGINIKESYVADEDGYRVEGDHLPKYVKDINK